MHSSGSNNTLTFLRTPEAILCALADILKWAAEMYCSAYLIPCSTLKR